MGGSKRICTITISSVGRDACGEEISPEKRNCLACWQWGGNPGSLERGGGFRRNHWQEERDITFPGLSRQMALSDRGRDKHNTSINSRARGEGGRSFIGQEGGQGASLFLSECRRWIWEKGG